MMVLPVTLGIGDSVCELGTMELPVDSAEPGRLTLDTSECRLRLARFLRAVVDTLDEGYTLRQAPNGD